MHRTAILAPLALAACMAVPPVPVCGCIIPPGIDGALNMAFLGEAVQFDNGDGVSVLKRGYNPRS